MDTSSPISRNENDSARLPRPNRLAFRQIDTRFRANLQGFESVRRFEAQSRCHISGNTKNKNHKLVMFGRGQTEFSNHTPPLC
jgi:hypothetical protein